MVPQYCAALALDNRTLVSYAKRQALVACSRDRTVVVPLPPGARLEAVTRVLHTGAEEPVNYAYQGGKGDRQSVRLTVQDSGGEVFFYRLRYERE